MVCLYCQSKTSVINSRHQKRSNTTWRRRQCKNCKSVFTSLESADLSSAMRIEVKNGTLKPFMRSKLFISIYDCCKHLSKAPMVADELTSTVLTKLLSSNQAIIPIDQITQTTFTTLKHFNKAASAQYGAFHDLT